MDFTYDISKVKNLDDIDLKLFHPKISLKMSEILRETYSRLQQAVPIENRIELKRGVIGIGAATICSIN